MQGLRKINILLLIWGVNIAGFYGLGFLADKAGYRLMGVELDADNPLLSVCVLLSVPIALCGLLALRKPEFLWGVAFMAPVKELIALFIFELNASQIKVAIFKGVAIAVASILVAKWAKEYKAYRSQDQMPENFE
jgi:hypothetical protein